MPAGPSNLIPYSTATMLAEAFQRHTARIRELALEIGTEVEALQQAFKFTDGNCSAFGIELKTHYGHDSVAPEHIDGLILEMTREAWKVLIEKLELRKIMSTKRVEEMNDALHKPINPRYAKRSDFKFPEITAETILSVLGGFAASADEYFQENLKEVFDWLRSRPGWCKLKTNNSDLVGRKVIKTYAVDRDYGSGGWRPNYNHSAQFQALDNVFHLLDGKGLPKTHRGPLHEAMLLSGSEGKGETEYFKFKCYGNRNFHLEFKRLDLLAEFNRRGGEMNIGQKRRAVHPGGTELATI